MRPPEPVTLERAPVRLEPLSLDHVDALTEAVRDGELWTLWFTSLPHSADDMAAYVQRALDGLADGAMLPWAVIDAATGTVIGSTRLHDILPHGRVEIGYTWYAKRAQRSAVNTTCKLLILQHAFETMGAGCVALRTDFYNHTSQRAIERLGARRDGVVRHFQARRDGSPRDTVFYSIIAAEWPDVKRHLEFRLSRHAG